MSKNNENVHHSSPRAQYDLPNQQTKTKISLKLHKNREKQQIFTMEKLMFSTFSSVFLSINSSSNHFTSSYCGCRTPCLKQNHLC